MTKASERELSALHGAVARSMQASLESTDVALGLLEKYKDADLPGDIYKFLREASIVNPSLLTAITKFLKDNNISSDIEEDNALSALQNSLNRKKTGTVTSIPFEE